ncbi:metacaspase-9-like [Rutidosis leptorrhynchoides]|uniref:metacaspase-9-like n=1 Tax=Rutidosis leptorrhynchoides TaxID=125765 RepID=UPI003A9A3A06
MASKKLAVLVGCNYANSGHDLQGCINDVVSIQEILVQSFGFEPKNIDLLTDAADQSNENIPNAVNIKAALNRMIGQAEPGDVLVFHYSGHGTTTHSKKLGRVCEAIVPCDFNLIIDVDFREMVNRVPKGASFTILADSCFSGGLIAREKEQIGPHVSIKGDISASQNSSKPRTIPIESILQHLQSLTQSDTPDIAGYLLELFGDDASLKFRLAPPELKRLDSSKPDEGILLSGCQSNEYSCDMPASVTGGKPHGAFTYALMEIFKDFPAGGLSNREVVIKAREGVKAQDIKTQHPCLYCTDQNADDIFLLGNYN